MNLRVHALIAAACFMLSQACSSGDDDGAGGAGSGGTGSGGTTQGTGGTAGSGGAAAICDSGCVATIAANCPNGPTDQAGCVNTCVTLGAGSCGTEYAAFQSCAVGKPISCNSDGIPAVAACSDEQAAFIACLN